MTKKHVSLLVVFVLLFTTLFSGLVFAADETAEESEWVIAEDITIKANYHQQTYGDQSAEGKGYVEFGKVGEKKRLEAISLTAEGLPEDAELRYGVHAQTYGDLPKDGLAVSPAVAGTKGEAKRLEGVQIGIYKKGTDDLYPGYQVAYQVHMKGYGWGADADNNWYKGNEEAFKTDGVFAGTKGLARWIEAVRVTILKPGELTVTDVTALNLKQIAVEFSQDVTDNKEVSKVDNYTLKDEDDDTVALADVDVDGNTAVLSVKDPLKNGDEVDEYPIEDRDDAVLTVSDKIISSEEDFEIEFTDTEYPEATDAAVVGSNTIKVTFSEPIRPVGYDDDDEKFLADEDWFDIDEYSIDKVELVNDNTEAHIITYSDFEDGEALTVSVDEAEDYDGKKSDFADFELEVVEDTTAPTVVDFKNSSLTGVTLVFDEDIRFTDDFEIEDIYHTNTRNEADAAKIDGNELVLTFETYEFDTGVNTVYIKADAIENLWGVENEKLEQDIEVDEDESKPVAESAEVDEDNLSDVIVTFSENVDVDTAEDEDNYTLLDEDKDEIDDNDIDAIEAEEDEVTITFDDALSKGDTYYLEIVDVVDKAGNPIDDTTLKITVEDDSAPIFPENAVLDGEDNDEYTIVIDYGEEMAVEGRYSVIDPENYELKVDREPYGLDELEDEFDVEVDIDTTDDNSIVEITIEDDDDDFDLVTDEAISSITVARVADVDGYKTEEYEKVLPFIASSDRFFTLSSVTAGESDVIEVELDDAIDDFNADDLAVVYVTSEAALSTTPSAVETVIASSAELTEDDVIELTLDDAELNADGTYTYDGTSVAAVYVVVKGDESRSKYGKRFQKDGEDGSGYKVVADEIAPELVETDPVVATTPDAIEVKFNEAIDPETVDKNDFSVEDKTIVSAVASGNVVTITISVPFTDAELSTNPDVSLNYAIEDENGNEQTDIGNVDIKKDYR